MDRERLAELFDGAVELPHADRAAWIARACAGDAPLLSELQRLLLADARATAFLETPPALILTSSADAGIGSLPQFGPWRALRHIGAGGMGEVWLAERSDGEFEQRAAVKQLAWPTPGLLQRFRQERQILARLEHPDIARLIDGGVDERGSPYLVMEYVEGVPITDYVRDHALDLRARLNIFVRVCGAVQYAHQNLVVHRDLKPSNILVGADGALKLLDFGIAKVLATTDEAAQTQTAARLLTPDYAAPEQFSGGAITTATDVYALGVVLYELLTDTRPPRRALPDKMADATEPPPPSTAGDRTTGNARRRAVRGDLDRIALTALAAIPQQRYASAEALSSDLQRYLAGQPISARRDSAWYRFRKFARRNRYALAAAVFVCAVSIAAAIISIQQAQRARAQARHAAALQQFMAGVFEQSNPDENKGQPITAQQLLEKGEEQLARIGNAQPALQVDVTAMLGSMYSDLGDRARADALLARALSELGSNRVPDDVRGRVLVSVATLESEIKDDYQAGLAHARDGLAALEQDAEKDWEEIAIATRIIALCLTNLRENEAAAALLQKAIPQHTAMLGAGPSEALANEWVLLGVALGRLARFEQAEAAFERGAAMLRTLYGDSSTRYGYALNEEASMLYHVDLPRAETLHREVDRINRARLGADHISTLASTYNLLGDIEAQGHVAEALPERLALLDRVVRSSTLSATKKAHHYDAVALDYSELGRFAEAEAQTRKALALIADANGARSPSSVAIERHLGLVLVLEGRYSEAEAAFRDALSIMLDAGTTTSLVACGLRRDIGATLASQHHYTEAIAQLQALTTDACMVGLSEADDWRPRALADLSLAQLDNGDAATAYETARQALHFGRKSLEKSYRLAEPLFAMARAALALERAGEAEPLLREALALRSGVHPAADPRILELKVSLINALHALKKSGEENELIGEVEPLLKVSTTPYAADLRERLATN